MPYTVKLSQLEVFMDAETAVWLAELIAEAHTDLSEHPGLTLEVESKTNQWVQIVPEPEDDGISLSGFLLNFPYRTHITEPLQTLTEKGLVAPPDTQTIEWQEDGFATIWVRPDIPLVALAHFAGDILQRVVGVDSDARLAVQIEYGF